MLLLFCGINQKDNITDVFPIFWDGSFLAHIFFLIQVQPEGLGILWPWEKVSPTSHAGAVRPCSVRPPTWS